MQVYSSSLIIDKQVPLPVYIQLTNQLMAMIKAGTLQPGHRLPSTRQMANLLTLHRKTVIRAYDELLAQGWLQSQAGSGTFVAGHLPVTKPRRLLNNTPDVAKVAGFSIRKAPHLERGIVDLNVDLHLDDGFPDTRLAPVAELSRAYRTRLLTGNPYVRLGYADPKGAEWLRTELATPLPYVRLGYADPKGAEWLRTELATYLNITRGLRVTPANILVVRGTVMGLYLTCTGLLQPGDTVVATAPGWAGAEANFLQAGAKLLTVPVDEYGMDVDRLDELCCRQAVRLVYVTSHHHYPTTVALRPDRRVRLLELAQKHGFIIFEDDYDYDFHYQNKPLMPLASADDGGMVLYCGAFSKSISPAIRVGYLVGPENVIEHLAQLRRTIDRQGDNMLENGMAELLQNGLIPRHLRKSLRIYQQRRDVFCGLLNDRLKNYVQFKVPEGGMAVWTYFDSGIDLNRLAQNALKKGLYFQGGNSPLTPNFTRLGFASSTPAELEQCVDILVKLLEK